MTILHTVILTAFHLEHHYLVALNEWVNHLSDNLCAFHCRRADCYGTVVVDEQHTVELNSLAGLNILDVIDKKLFACLCLELLTVNLYDCVHFVYYKRFFRKADDVIVPPLVLASTDSNSVQSYIF